MRRWQSIGFLAGTLLLGWAVGCKSPAPNNEPDPTPKPGQSGTPLDWKTPANFPKPAYDFENNALTKEGVLLGRMLFYDPLLSKDGTVSCAFCHSPFTAFAHTDHPVSHGIQDRQGTRNVPGIQNVAWQSPFFWDGGVTDLDKLPIAPIENPLEMDEKLPNVLNKIRTSGRYRPLFRAAYGSDSITSERFLKALSQFMLTMTTSNSVYDQVARKEPGAALTAAAQRGYVLFQQKCSSCHKEPFLTDQSFRNNGLTPNKADDKGRYVITAQSADLYKFKVPTLRNVDRTPPYMHDGRFSSLQAVLRHYATGVQDSPTLDPLLKQNGQLGIPMTPQEQNDIIAFLYSLTDYTFLQNPDLQPLR